MRPFELYIHCWHEKSNSLTLKHTQMWPFERYIFIVLNSVILCLGKIFSQRFNGCQLNPRLVEDLWGKFKTLLKSPPHPLSSLFYIIVRYLAYLHRSADVIIIQYRYPVLRIRIQDPGSGAFSTPWIRDPRCVDSIIFLCYYEYAVTETKHCYDFRQDLKKA